MPEIIVEPTVPEEAFTRWRAHRDRFTETGLWPVIVPMEAVGRLRESVAEQAPSVAKHIEEGEALAPTFFMEILKDRRDNMQQDEEWREEDAPDLDFDPAGMVPTEWPPVEEQIVNLREPGGFALVLVPCAACWEIPAILGQTGGDLYPPTAEHVAALREWHARHGAEPLVFGGDTVALLVRPIRDPAEAKRVAIEHYAHCEDLVDGGMSTVQALAASLLGATVWYFWWD